MAQRKARISIADLWQGSSSQPDYKRRPGQVEEARNLRLDPVDGARTRSGTLLVADIGGSTQTGWVWTSLNEWIIRAKSGIVEVIDRSGYPQTVNVQGGANAYLTSNNLQLVPYLNSVLILNPEKTVLTQTTPAYAVAGEKDVFTDLEGVTTPNGSVWKVLLTEAENPAGYYRATATNPNLLQWERVAAPSDVDGRYDRTTMPVQLLYANSQWTLRYLTWEDRKSGSSVTNAKMPWAGDTIRSLSIWNNRLVLKGKDSFTTSETLSSQQEGFNLWRDDVATPVDTDPIVLYFDLPNVGAPVRSVVIGRDLLVACENGQVAVTSGDSPPSPLKFNVAMRLVSSYKSRDIPLRANGEETVLVDRDGYLHLYSYQGVVNGIQKVLTLNEHRKDVLSGYNPTEAFQIGQAVFIPNSSSSSVAVHDRFVVNGQASQLAWSEYIFDRRVVYMDVYGSVQYVVTQGTNPLNGQPQFSLLQYDHDNIKRWFSGEYDLRMDRMHQAFQISYDPATNRTGYNILGTGSDNVWLVDITDTTPRMMRPVAYSGDVVYVKGNTMERTVYAGWSFESRLVLSKLWIGNAKTMLQRMAVFFHETTDFVVRAGRQGQPKSTVYTHQSSLPASASAETGSVDFTVLGDARSMEIELVHNSPGSATFTALQYTVNAMEGG